MTRFVAKRLLMMIPVLLGVSVLVFTLISLTPGDPASFILGSDATQEQIDALNEQLGYNKPLPIRYWDYLTGVLRLDFGTSYTSNLPIVEELLAGDNP